MQGGGRISPTIMASNMGIHRIEVNKEMEAIREELADLRSKDHIEFIKWGIGGLVCIAYQEIIEGNERSAEYIFHYIGCQPLYKGYITYMASPMEEYPSVLFTKKVNKIWDRWSQAYVLKNNLKDLALKMRTDPESRRLFVECVKAESTSLLDLWRPADRLKDIWDESTDIKFRIRKLTPIEAFRLMGFTDEDFWKAKSANSNSQMYKLAGNSICSTCLMALFSQLHIKGCPVWNEISVEERNELVDRTRKNFTPDLRQIGNEIEDEEEDSDNESDNENEEW